jgi:hypothetical protein
MWKNLYWKNVILLKYLQYSGTGNYSQHNKCGIWISNDLTQRQFASRKWTAHSKQTDCFLLLTRWDYTSILKWERARSSEMYQTSLRLNDTTSQGILHSYCWENVRF